MHSDEGNSSQVIMQDLGLTCNTVCNYIFSINI